MPLKDSQAVQGIGLLALMLAVALLITPSMTHQIAYRGEDRREERFASHPKVRWPGRGSG